MRDFNCFLINSASLHVISVISASATVVAGGVVSMSNTVADLSLKSAPSQIVEMCYNKTQDNAVSRE